MNHHVLTLTPKANNAAQSDDPSVLVRIYEQRKNMAIWQRTIGSQVQLAAANFVRTSRRSQLSMTLAPDNAFAAIHEAFNRDSSNEALARDIAELVDMFAYLFELKRVGLRLGVLDSAMCPKFHTDHVPCRLVTTYLGEATQWLPNRALDRSKLGHASGGLLDHESGLYAQPQDIQQLSPGDVALLKGERWEGNEGLGLVHRSPHLKAGERRLLLTLDFSD